MHVTHHRQQWPVGHGFLHTASVEGDRDAQTHRYVYDCGSVARTVVEAQIDRYADNELMEGRALEIDMLVLSHFHADHVNGLPHLLKLFKVKKLVLPFLSDDFALAALAGLAAEGTDVWSEFSGLVLAPQVWMRARGQEDVQVTRVAPDGPNGQDAQVANANGVSLPAGTINHHVPGTLGAGGGEFWHFRFYVSENWERYLHLLDALISKFNPTDEVEFFGWLSDADWIALHHVEVNEAFRSLGSSNQNAITLCMYSGPARGKHSETLVFTSSLEPMAFYRYIDYHWNYRWRPIGWLATGDAELCDTESFDAFAKHFAPYDHAVDTLTIPHHGSIENYCPALAGLGESVVLTSDSEVDPHGHHPNEKVIMNLRTRCCPFHIVTRDEGSALFSYAKVAVDD